MPRRNANVRQRNVPRAAQKQPRTNGAQFGSRDYRPYSRQDLARRDELDGIALDSRVYSPLEITKEHSS